MKNLKFEIGSDEIHYLELGESGDIPVLFFHGFPGSGSQALIFQPFIESHKLHVISPERPGYGNSTAARARDYKTFLSGCLQLVEAKGWTQFHVVGLSGGGPYARAMAKLAPDKVISCICLAGLGVLDETGILAMRGAQRTLLKFFKRAPSPIARKVLRGIVAMARPKRLLAHLISQSPPADRVLLQNPEVQTHLLESFTQGLRQREAGVYFDIYNYLHNTHETVGEFRCPVVFFHGTDDNIVPLIMSEELKKRIPHAELVVLPEEGHYSLAINGAAHSAAKILALHAATKKSV